MERGYEYYRYMYQKTGLFEYAVLVKEYRKNERLV